MGGQIGQICPDGQTGSWTNCQTSSSLQFTCSSLQWWGSWSMSPSSPAPLAVNWAPARPCPFIASICQSLQAWMVPETLYKWGTSFHLYLAPSLHLFNALSILESKQVWPRAVRGKQWLNKSRGSDITMGRWLMFSPRSLSLNLAVPWYFTAGYIQVCVAKLQCHNIECTENHPKVPHYLLYLIPYMLKEYISVDYFRPDRCTARSIVWSGQWEMLSSAHVLQPSHGLHAGDKSSHSNKPFTIVIFVCLALRQTCNVQRKTCHMGPGRQEAEPTARASLRS